MFDKKAYMKEYNKKHYVDQRAWLKAHPETKPKHALLHKKWRENNRQRVRDAQTKQRKRRLVQIHANSLVRRKPLASQCKVCGTIEKLERHHPDYSKPLEYITICKDCHAKQYSEIAAK